MRICTYVCKIYRDITRKVFKLLLSFFYCTAPGTNGNIKMLFKKRELGVESGMKQQRL